MTNFSYDQHRCDILERIMSKKILMLFGALIVIFGSLYFYTGLYGLVKGTDVTILSPLDQAKKILKKEEKEEIKPTNILLLGIDRRSRAETSFRSDIMILMAVNPAAKKIVLISVPRDLWAGGGRINAVYAQNGWKGIQSAFERITGLKPDNFILTDFSDFSWVVDAMNGVSVNVDKTFTDSEFPVDATKGYQTVIFTQGTEKLTGARALIFSRSRHGNNGEGSDWMRQKRQHLILKGMKDAIIQPGSIFNPMVIEKAFDTVTNERMDTNLTLKDAKYLWDLYKNRDQYTIESIYMNDDYLYNPPMSDYGGAWVLIPRNNDYSAFHRAVSDAINGVKSALESTESIQ